jgi:hypothetical protein
VAVHIQAKNQAIEGKSVIFSLVRLDIRADLTGAGSMISHFPQKTTGKPQDIALNTRSMLNSSLDLIDSLDLLILSPLILPTYVRSRKPFVYAARR